MVKDAKKERNARKELGYKHEWIDTRGHSHRIFFVDKKTLEKPKTTWVALGIVAVLTFLLGGAVLLTAPDAPNGGRIYFGAESSTPQFALKTSLVGLTTQTATAVAAGWNGEFFLASPSEIALFDADGQKLDSWPLETKVAPTALSFVASEDSPKNGLLLIGYPNRVDAISFDVGTPAAPDPASNENSSQETPQVVDENARFALRTAAKGALGPATTVLSIPSAEIAAVASSDDRLFVADRKAERVWRYSWKKLDALKDSESKETPPDCEIGAPDVASGYPGLRPAIGSYFNAVYSPANGEIFVANSGLFRVDAFNADSGSRVAEHSWTKTPGFERAFGGLANPVAVVVSPNGWIATVESQVAEANANSTAKGAKSSPFQIFDLNGNWIAEIPRSPRANGAFPMYFAAALSADSARLYALDSTGAVDVFVERP